MISKTYHDWSAQSSAAACILAGFILLALLKQDYSDLLLLSIPHPQKQWN